jgi:tRNA1(Val) A37 N6-methylase TrmN6
MSASGIVRPARRPPAWRAPGPPPAAPAQRPELWPQTGEDLCHLSGDWRILQRLRGHRWSLDDLVTAWLAARSVTADPVSIADLGCGIGAVLLMLAWRFPAARCAGVEAQAGSAALARRSIAWNGAENRCAVHDGDLRDPAPFGGGARFELVTGTPPYLPAGSGREPTRPLQAACHIEQRGGIEDYCSAAARLLAPTGRFVVCHAAAQIARVQGAAARAGLRVEARMAVIPRAGKAPLFCVYSMRPTAGREHVLPTLVVRDERGQWTPEFRALRADMGMP